jgi:hypothetical protein
MTKRQRKQSFQLFRLLVVGLFFVSGLPSLRAQSPSKRETSCRVFVQKFYDWYLTSDSRWYDVAKLKPKILGPELRKLLIKEDEIQTKCKCIDHLDADPFLNSQDPDRRYAVKTVNVDGDRCNATVKGVGEDAAEVRPELEWTTGWWIFVNFHYSFYSEDAKRKLYPDTDLISVMKR